MDGRKLALMQIAAVIAFLIDFTSFFVGIICFADFDKGLRSAKSSEAPVVSQPKSPSETGNGTTMFERNPSYSAAPLQPRMSIE
jgi:lipopolysaccharide export LptBFGC system permease protein LptF